MRQEATLPVSSILKPGSDPYLLYHRLREQAPLHRLSPSRWVSLAYDESVGLLQHPACSHWGQDPQTQNRMSPVQKALAKTLNALSPGSDLPYRRLILQRLAGRSLSLEEDYVRTSVQGIFKRLREKDEIDFVSEYADPVTFQVISRVIGVAEAQMEELTHIIGRLNGSYLGCIAGARDDVAGGDFIDFLDRLVESKKRNPASDLCSSLLGTDGGGEESRNFVISMLILLFYAGHENMMNFLGNAAVALHESAAVERELRQSPEQMNDAIDELLRYDSPLQFILLHVRADIPRNQVTIPAGSQLLIGVGAANRDPKVFADPNRLDIRRKPAHLSFGTGSFRCIGAALARLEGTVGLSAFLHNTVEFSILDNPVRWREQTFVQRGPSSLRMRVAWK